MNSKRYWKNRLPFLLTNLVCMAALTVFLLVCGNSVSAVVLILIVWALILLMGLVLTYWKRKRQMKKLLDMAEQLSERYLISEVMELPEQAEDQVYYQLLKMAGKSMLEQIGEVERERLEYKEYIEQWIHEIKTPITAMKLLCENHRMDWTKELLLELEKTNRFTEQALYYARSEHIEKDYSVREMALSQVVHQAIADNKYLLLQSGMRLEVEEMQDTVYSDEKWVRFILNQLIANAVKYRTEQPVLRISTHKRQDQVVLVVEDNGIGIAASDLPRIFEKGFTGQNGRLIQQSTGIGLYLCKRLCEKLGIYIEDVACFPQAYAAAATMLHTLVEEPKAVILDIGGFTADYLLMKNGEIDLTSCDSLENGVILLYNKVRSKVNSELDLLLDEGDVDAILMGKKTQYPDAAIRLTEQMAQEFINDLFSTLRERMLDLQYCKVVFVGGGAILLKRQIETSGKVGAPFFVSKINANADGYEYLYRIETAGR